MYHSKQGSLACEESTLEVRQRYVFRMSRESVSEGNALGQIWVGNSQRGEAQRCHRNEAVNTGMEVGERKRRSATAPAACARELLWRRCMRVRLADSYNVNGIT
eukprot:3922080-Pleurochrysis_carterae.AAC.2